MSTYEALVRVNDYRSFINRAYNSRNSIFKTATTIALEERCEIFEQGIVSIRSEDRLNVEDILITDLGMEIEEADLFICKR